MSLTHHRLLEVLAYNESTGVFTRIGGGWAPGIGKAAGTIERVKCARRVNIYIDSQRYRAHRLAWFFVHREWPSGDIDHIDGNPINNAIANLRCVNRSVNMENQRRARSDSKLGILGVSQRSQNSFQAEIGVRGVRHRLGSFDSAEEAHQAYLTAKRQLHVGCTI